MALRYVRQIFYDVTDMWNLKKPPTGWELSELGRCCGKVQTETSRLQKSWRSNAQHSDNRQQHCVHKLHSCRETRS